MFVRSINVTLKRTVIEYLLSYDIILLLYFIIYITICIFSFNTFASQRFVLDEKYKLFLLENASNLTHRFMYDNFNKKIYQNFLVKITFFFKYFIATILIFNFFHS